jgi:hypothetical protein
MKTSSDVRTIAGALLAIAGGLFASTTLLPGCTMDACNPRVDQSVHIYDHGALDDADPNYRCIAKFVTNYDGKNQERQETFYVNASSRDGAKKRTREVIEQTHKQHFVKHQTQSCATWTRGSSDECADEASEPAPDPRAPEPTPLPPPPAPGPDRATSDAAYAGV